jgi:hypothetical protein
MSSDDNDFLIGDILGGDGREDLETEFMPTARAYRLAARRKVAQIGQRQALSDLLCGLPAAGESIHVVSEAKFDFWTWVPVLVGWLGGRTEALYCSTWTLSRNNAVEMFGLWDAGAIGAAHFLTGTYFKRRETAVYAMLLDGIRARGGRYRAFQNHAKVLLLSNAGTGVWISVEGSANLTSNPRLEQYVLTNDKGLYDFHRGWMEECFRASFTANVEQDRAPGSIGPE